MAELAGSITRFPALRCRVGIWTYYLTAMPYFEVAERVKRTNRTVDNQRLHMLLQRELNSSNLKQIAAYLVREGERFFNSVVIGVEGGDPNWYPLEIDGSGVYGPLSVDLSIFSNFLGVLELDRTERMFTIDGQHRVEGIKEALRQDPNLRDQQLPVVFIAHLDTEKGLRRTRKLFSTLNRYVTPVSPGDIVQMDEDDGYAIVTRELVRKHWALMKVDDETAVAEGRQAKWMVEPASGVQLPGSNRHSFTTILSLYNQCKVIYPSRYGDRTRLSRIRPPDKILEAMYEFLSRFWDNVGKHNPTLKKVFESEPGDGVVGSFRHSEGGSVLLRPAGQIAFCEAIRIMMFRQVPMAEAVEKVSAVPTMLDAEPWLGVLWDGTKMKTADARLNRNLFLHMAGEPPERPSGPEKETYDLTVHYRTVLNNDQAVLPAPLSPMRRRKDPVGLNGR